MERNIAVRPVTNDIASCCICYARNYDSSHGVQIGKRIGTILEIDFGCSNGASIVRLCPDCMRILLNEGRKAVMDVEKIVAYAIVTGDDFKPQIVRGEKKTKADGSVEIIVKEVVNYSTYTFTKEGAEENVFDTEEEAQAHLADIRSKPLN